MDNQELTRQYFDGEIDYKEFDKQLTIRVSLFEYFMMVGIAGLVVWLYFRII